MSQWRISIETTPNPEAMKFVANQPIADQSRSFNTAAEASLSPLAKKIFGFPWARGVLIGPDFVSIVKQEWVGWDTLAEPLAQLIQEHLERGEGVLPAAGLEPTTASADENDSPLVRKIKDVLDRDIRPAVAMDGGDIIFQRFEDGKVYLHMQGACSGCPSSTFTLKEGIETRLKAQFPEVQEVVSV